MDIGQEKRAVNGRLWFHLLAHRHNLGYLPESGLPS
jgi:hypothetical protein